MAAKLNVLGLSEAAEWDDIVRSFASWDIYYLSAYVKAFQLHGDGEPLLFYGEGDGVRGILVVMERDVADDPRFADKLPKGVTFDFATPYGYGGWLLEGEGDPAPLYEAYRRWCGEHGIVSEFVRFSLFSNSMDSYYGDVVPRTQNVVRALDRPMDEMRMDFEHKVRKNLRRAEQSGLQFIADPKGDRLADFLRIYYGTMERTGAERRFYFGEAFFRQLEQLRDGCMFFHAALDGQIVSTELVLLGSKAMYSYLGGTEEAFYAYRANDFLKCRIIEWGLEHGVSYFVLGGGYGADDGIFRYKKSFAPNGVRQFYIGQTVFDEAACQKLISLRGELPESRFFPAYRA